MILVDDQEKLIEDYERSKPESDSLANITRINTDRSGSKHGHIEKPEPATQSGVLSFSIMPEPRQEKIKIEKNDDL